MELGGLIIWITSYHKVYTLPGHGGLLHFLYLQHTEWTHVGWEKMHQRTFSVCTSNSLKSSLVMIMGLFRIRHGSSYVIATLDRLNSSWHAISQGNLHYVIFMSQVFYALHHCAFVRSCERLTHFMTPSSSKHPQGFLTFSNIKFKWYSKTFQACFNQIQSHNVAQLEKWIKLNQSYNTGNPIYTTYMLHECFFQNVQAYMLYFLFDTAIIGQNHQVKNWPMSIKHWCNRT